MAASLPASYSKSLQLDVDNVWNGLLIYWLLEDADERSSTLQLLHDAPSQAKRLQPALRARNDRLAGTGQEAWNHACDRCCWIKTFPDGRRGYIRATVTDGVTIGRPTCSVHDCDIPLDSVKDRYCPEHLDQDKQCAVTSCTLSAEPHHRTCSIREHRALEDYNSEQNKAMFQLKRRLARLKTSQPRDAVPDSELGDAPFNDEEVLIDKNGDCTDKPDEGNRSLRARFGRRRTHNEELCVATCGVILGRATFYGSEAPNGVRTFWTKLFPTRRALPGVLFHDNSCRIAAMLRSEGDEYFKYSALPVDVFHFKSKHKESDTDCGTYCNPVLWKDLMTPQGFRFNSSAAEQANAWIGGYQAVVREMQADRYEFFLDEMIRRRNRDIISELRTAGQAPYEIPREELLRPESPEILDDD
ncbi:hypothetical protein CPC08DRAFT_771030 [Agrocybe pediades]|nr:hypothetical protein CPC08DRAFT_771030 [Agrocybe pediades]